MNCQFWFYDYGSSALKFLALLVFLTLTSRSYLPFSHHLQIFAPLLSSPLSLFFSTHRERISKSHNQLDICWPDRVHICWNLLTFLHQRGITRVSRLTVIREICKHIQQDTWEYCNNMYFLIKFVLNSPATRCHMFANPRNWRMTADRALLSQFFAASTTWFQRVIQFDNVV